MKGLLYSGPGKIDYETLPDPAIADDRDAVVKVDSCAICGSDLHILHGHMPASEECYSVGHEAVGEVMEVGRGVHGLKAGDKVMMPGSVGCGTCRPCLAGLVNKCENGGVRVYGIGRGLPGCQTEALTVPVADFNAIKIPEGISEDQALMLTDTLPTAYMGCKNADIGPGKSVGIIGLGPIGLNAVEIAFVMGATVVYAIDLLEDRRAAAEELGAIALDPVDALERITEDTKGRLLDCTVEVVGLSATTDLAIALAGQHSTVSAIGAALPRYDFPMVDAFRKAITFRPSICSVQQYQPELTELLRAGRLKPEQQITHRMKLSEGTEAYRMFDQREEGVRKIVLKP